MTGKVDPGSILTPAVQLFIEQQAFEKAKLITGTTKDLLEDRLSQALDEGWSPAKLGQSIRELYEDMAKPRSDTIARTEMTASVNHGLTETLTEEGHKEKEWSTVLDGRERDTHADANGQVVGIDEPFRVGGGSGQYPGDPSLPIEEIANCRCSIVIPNISEDRKQAVYSAFLRLHGALERRLVVSLRREFAAQKQRVLSHFPS